MKIEICKHKHLNLYNKNQQQKVKVSENGKYLFVFNSFFYFKEILKAFTHKFFVLIKNKILSFLIKNLQILKVKKS